MIEKQFEIARSISCHLLGEEKTISTRRCLADLLRKFQIRSGSAVERYEAPETVAPKRADAHHWNI